MPIRKCLIIEHKAKPNLKINTTIIHKKVQIPLKPTLIPQQRYPPKTIITT